MLRAERPFYNARHSAANHLLRAKQPPAGLGRHMNNIDRQDTGDSGRLLLVSIHLSSSDDSCPYRATAYREEARQEPCPVSRNSLLEIILVIIHRYRVWDGPSVLLAAQW